MSSNHDGKLREQLRALRCKPILIATFPRSGTHLTIDTLRAQFAECRSWKLPVEPLDRLFLTLDLLVRPKRNLSHESAIRILRRAKRPIIKTHALPDFQDVQLFRDPVVALPSVWKDWLRENATILYVVRDGRDVLASMHSLIQIRRPETRVRFGDFLRLPNRDVNFVRSWANHVRDWIQLANVFVLRFEDLRRDPEKTIARIGEHLQLEPRYQEPLIPPRLRSDLHARWTRLASVRPRSTAVVGRYRKQEPENWQSALTTDDKCFFEREAGDVLKMLGYESCCNWTCDATISPINQSAA